MIIYTTKITESVCRDVGCGGVCVCVGWVCVGRIAQECPMATKLGRKNP